MGRLLLRSVEVWRGWKITIPEWFRRTTLWVGTLGLPLLLGIIILTYEETLSSGEGMQHALAEKFPHLFNQHLADNQLPPLEIDATELAGARLQSISRQVLERGLLRRDLVITGSCLEQTSQEMPSDLYFYVPANRSEAPPRYGKRGVLLLEWPHILLDVVMGSGSIFPVFPPRRIEDFPRPEEQIELVDGGFAHNSPVEAAVLWGATHIVLIEATPRQRSKRGNFLRNAGSSFSHLHRQAQLLDARSRGQVTVFSISPEPPHICVLDFAENLIADSIERGYRDAGKNITGTARFRKELGKPVFSNVSLVGQNN